MSPDFLLYALIGFAAQLVDGALGMGYGIVAASALLASGVPPALASATVHVTKVPTGIASGFWHWRMGNVDRVLWRRLIVPGLVGGAIGASAVSLAPADYVRPFAAGYLSLMGLVVVLRTLRKPAPRARAPRRHRDRHAAHVAERTDRARRRRRPAAVLGDVRST